MFQKIKKYWKIFWMFKKIQLMRMTEYRADFIFWTFISSMWGLFNFFFLNILVGVNNNIAGWNKAEMYVLIGTFTMLDGLMWSLIYKNMSAYTQLIFTGNFSFHLTKPINPIFVLTTEQGSYNNIPRILIGASILFHGVNRLSYSPSLSDFMIFFALLCVSFIMLFACWFALATFSFWMEKFDSINDIFPNILQLWRYPRSIYSGVISLILTVILPLSLMTSLPAEVLIGRFNLKWIVYYVAFVIFFVYLVKKFFYFSIKKYSSIGN